MPEPDEGAVNLITYALGGAPRVSEVKRYLDLQVLNSLRCGWRPEQIQLRTDFDYRCADHPVKTLHVNAGKKRTFAKWIGVRDALLGGARKIWSHDHDGWQLNSFPPMAVEGIRMFRWSSHGGSPLLCSASFFLTAEALPFVSALVDFEEQHYDGRCPLDEYVLAEFLAANPGFSEFVATDLPITYCYNHYGDRHRVGLARLDYLHHKLPIVLRGFPLDLPDGFKSLLEAGGHGG